MEIFDIYPFKAVSSVVLVSVFEVQHVETGPWKNMCCDWRTFWSSEAIQDCMSSLRFTLYEPIWMFVVQSEESVGRSCKILCWMSLNCVAAALKKDFTSLVSAHKTAFEVFWFLQCSHSIKVLLFTQYILCVGHPTDGTIVNTLNRQPSCRNLPSELHYFRYQDF